MGGQVSKEAQDKWLESLTPVKGEFRAFMVGLACGTLFHENPFGLQWEREQIMYRLQKIRNPAFAKLMWALGQFCSGEFLVPYFAFLYWLLDKYKCVYGIWLVPISEVANGLLKWWCRVPRPGWVDPKIKMMAWSHEYSFPSSHAQIVWALASFFSGTSLGILRDRLYGSWGRTLFAYWYSLVGPYAFAALVSLSRVYEGVHYPRDVVVGSGIGVSLASVYMHVLPSIRSALLKQSIPKQILILETFTFLWLIAVISGHKKSRSRPHPDQHMWATTASVGPNKGLHIDVHTTPLASYMGMVGVLAGLSLAVPLIPALPSVQIRLPSTWLNALLRFVVGNAGLLSVYFGIRHVEKQVCVDGTVEARVARFLRYGSVPVSILLMMPYVFNKLRI